jgi:hypothetical protein
MSNLKVKLKDNFFLYKGIWRMNSCELKVARRALTATVCTDIVDNVLLFGTGTRVRRTRNSVSRLRFTIPDFGGIICDGPVRAELSGRGNVVNALSSPLFLIQVECRDFFLTLDICVKISANFEPVPFEQIVDKVGEQIGLFWREKSSVKKKSRHST